MGEGSYFWQVSVETKLKDYRVFQKQYIGSDLFCEPFREYSENRMPCNAYAVLSSDS